MPVVPGEIPGIAVAVFGLDARRPVDQNWLQVPVAAGGEFVWTKAALRPWTVEAAVVESVQELVGLLVEVLDGATTPQ